MGEAFRVAPDELKHIGSDTLLYVFQYLQFNFTEKDGCSEMRIKGWKRASKLFFVILCFDEIHPSQTYKTIE